MSDLYPGVEIRGENYPPPPAKQALSSVVQVGTLALLAVLLFGERIFGLLGVPPPEWHRNAMQNQAMALFFVYFVGSTLVTNLRNTGAFEVYVDDTTVWSKLQAGRLPQWPELLDRLAQAGVSAAVPAAGNTARM